MKNMKKLLQRAMVFTLTAAMLVGTPMTASAAGLVDLYSVSDGTNDDINHEDPNGSHTGTVTNTDTTSDSTILTENYLKIIGLALDKNHVDAVKGTKEDLTATVLLNEDNPEFAKVLAGKIKWQVLYSDGSAVKNGVAANKVLSISASADDRTKVTLNPRQGTGLWTDGDMIVKATIEGNYGVVEHEDGSKTVEKLTTNNTEDYTEKATVFIKEYSNEIWFESVEEKQIEKHTLDLSQKLKRDPETANDTITWSSSDTKIATVTAAGVVTFKKATAEGKTVKITAVSEKGKQDYVEFTVGKGIPASKVVITQGENNPQTGLFANKDKQLNLDLGKDDEKSADVYVQMYAKVKGYRLAGENDVEGEPAAVTGKPKTIEVPDGELFVNEKGIVERLEVTDVVTWTSAKPAIASVAGDKEGAEITAISVGKAKVTAKATSNKKADITVNVKATLNDLWIEGIDDDDTLYSGQSVTLTAGRDPETNKDAVKWSIEKVNNKANPNATINNKGVLTIKPKLDLAKADKVTVLLETKATTKVDGVKAPVKSAKVTINLAQSNINSITVKDVTAGKPIATAIYNDAKKKVVVNDGLKGAANTTDIKVPKTKSYTIEAWDENGSSAVQTLDVKTSNAKVAEVSYDKNGEAKITAVAKGNATVTVSGVRAGKAIKTTFKVAVTQPTTSLTLDKTSVVLKATGKKQSVSFKAKQNKGAAEKITWALDGEKQGVTINPNNGKVTLDKNAYNAGDVFTVTAKSQSGVTATATIQIITTSAGVQVLDKEGKPFTYQNKKNKTVNKATVLALGREVELFPQVNVGTAKAQNWIPAGETDGDKVASNVTYSVNKKGIVQIIGNTVYRVGNGSVKITIKTADGKSCTLTIDDIDKQYEAPSAE